VTDVIEYKQFIGGEFVASASGETLDVVNPAQDQVIARVPKSGAEDVDRAVEAAAKAFETWGKSTPQDRSLTLLKIADALEAKGEELGRLESRNAGKVTAYAIDEMAVCVDLFRFFAGACRQMEGKAVTEYLAGPGDGQHRRPQAVGPDPADGPGLRRDRRRVPAAGCPQRPVRRRRGDGRFPDHPPEGPDDLDHRRHRDREARGPPRL
jgi:hypothetical protein